MTYSVVVWDEASGSLAVAVQSKVIAAGAGLAWAQAGVGAIATQATIARSFGPDGLAMLRAGVDPEEATGRLIRDDALGSHRQVGIVGVDGSSHSFTGRECIPWAGHRVEPGIAAQGNILAGPRVVDDLFEVARGAGRLAERLVDALRAAELAGGDRRGRQAAALLVVAPGSPDGPDQIDLRVDDDPEPIERLAVLLRAHRLMSDPPSTAALVPLNDALAYELITRLTAAGVTPERVRHLAIPELEAAIRLDLDGVVPGDPQPFPDAWDVRWQAALESWMTRENLGARFAAVGWVDARVVDHLRTATDAELPGLSSAGP